MGLYFSRICSVICGTTRLALPLRIVGGRAANASRSTSTSIWDGISDFISSRQPLVRDCILSRLPEFADLVVEQK